MPTYRVDKDGKRTEVQPATGNPQGLRQPAAPPNADDNGGEAKPPKQPKTPRKGA